MQKNKLFFLATLLSFSSLMAFDSNLVEPEVAVKMINSKNIQFISIGEKQNIISGSQIVDIDAIIDIDIIGNMKCEPFLICPKKLKTYLENRGIKSSQEFILYDSQYGINATTFYSILKAIGHENVKVLHGGYESIQSLDPNQKTYNKYLEEKKSFLSKDNNSSKNKILMENLNNKLMVLKPLLLVKKIETITNKDTNITYDLDRSKFNFDELVDRDLLKKAVQKVREEGSESNISILDSCSMIDIVGNLYGSYLSGVTSIDWKELVDVKRRTLKSKELLVDLFTKQGLKPENDVYVYCMGGSQKAFYMAFALHQVGYKKVKVFSGDWSVWKGDLLR